MKKLLIINNNLQIGGIQKSLVNLLNEIKDEYKIELLIFNFDGEYKNSIPKEVDVIECSPYLKLLGMSLRETKQLGWYYYIIRGTCSLFTKIHNNYLPIKILAKTQKQLGPYDYAISYIHSSKPEIFYGGTNEVVLFKVDAKEKIGFIHCDYLEYGCNTPYTKVLYSKFDKIAACSEGCKNKFIEALPELSRKTYCVQNSQNYEKIKSLSLINPIIYDTNYVNIITVARLAKEKGIERAIKAISNCISLGHNIRYHVIGDGSECKYLQDLVLKNNIENNIFFYGSQENPYRYMKNANLLLVPSYYEAAPMVFGEAKCLGIPILSTETTSTRDMIEDCKAGWVCENSTEGLQKKLEYIIENKNEIDNIKTFLKSQKYDNEKAINQFKFMIEENNSTH